MNTKPPRPRTALTVRLAAFWARLRTAPADSRGVAAVEFAMISTVLLLLASGAYDISRAFTGQRDTSRASVEVSQALANCVTSSCVLAAGMAVTAAQATIFPNTPGMVQSWAYVSRQGNNVLVSFGNMTYLPSDVSAVALKTLADNDNGVCVLVTYDGSRAMIGVWPSTWAKFRSINCALQSKDVKMV